MCAGVAEDDRYEEDFAALVNAEEAEEVAPGEEVRRLQGRVGEQHARGGGGRGDRDEKGAPWR